MATDYMTNLLERLGENPAAAGVTQDPYANVTPEQAKTVGETLIDFTPVVGDVKSGIEAIDFFTKGQYGNSALSAVGVLPFVPSLLGTMRGPTKNLFHGSSKPITNIDDNFYSPMNFYGQGFYTTDSMDIAKGYTKKGRYLASQYNIPYEPTLYRIEQPNKINLFDMESPLSADTKEALTETLGDYSYLLDEYESKNLRELYDNLRIDGTNDFMSADDIQGYYDSIKDVLQKKGYKGLEHKGGLLTNPSWSPKIHNVRIYWEPTKDIKYKELKPEVMTTSRAKIIE